MKGRTKVRAALLGSITTALFYPAVATAQVQAPPSPAEAPEEASADIVVTAQRREQRLTDVPISVTAASGVELQRSGVTTTRELQLVTPGLTLQSTGPWLQPAIRGVTSQATSPGSEQNVAIYVDGVYQPFAAANAFELPDVQRIEVLKGPQGTLFGRNATGGAIQLITLEPSFDTTGKVTAAYGRFQDTELTGYITGPLSDSIAISVAGSHRSSDGWNRNLLTGERYGEIRSDIIREKILFKPSDSVKFLLSGFYSKRTDEAVSASSLLNGNGTARRFNTPAAPNTYIIPDEPFEVAPGARTIVYTKNYGFSLRGDIDLGIGTLTTTTAYLKNKFHLLTDGDSTTAPLLSFNLFNPPKTASQELVFASDKFGKFSFVTGAYAYRSRTGYIPGLFITSGATTSVQRAKTIATSYAGFAEATFDITDELSLIGGARYTYERRSVVFSSARLGVVPVPIKDHASFNRVTPRASLSYKIQPNMNIYATYSEGFKSGVYDVSGTAPRLVDPEKLRAYEVGFKTATNKYAFTAAGFYSNYDNLQVVSADPITGIARQQNAGKARIYGGELSLKYNLTPELSVVAQGAYTHATYTEFPLASVVVPAVNAAGVPIGGNISVTKDLKGFTLARAPRLSGNLGLNYDKKVGDDTLSISALAYYTSKYAIENGFRIVQPKYVQLNANIGWTFGDSGLTVGLYGKNLTNRTIFLSNSILATGDNVSYQERRSYGVNAGFKF